MSQTTLTSKPECFTLVPPQTDSDDADCCVATVDFSEKLCLLAAARATNANVALFDLSQQIHHNSGANPGVLASWKAHTGMLSFCRFLKDNNNNNNGHAAPSARALLATASEDGTIKIWDVRAIIAQQQEQRQQPPQESNTNNENNNNNNSINNGADGDNTEPAATFGLVACLNAGAEINCFAQSSDTTRIYAGCEDGRVVVFNSNNTENPVSERFVVSEEAVNDIAVAPTPYGDIVFTGADDGCVRCWRTFPGQRAPKEVAAPTADEMRQKLNEVQQGDNNGGDSNNNQQNNNNEEDQDDRCAAVRQLIAASIGDEACNRLLTSFDALQGKNAINHILVSDLANGAPHIFLSCGPLVFAVAFDMDSGSLDESPSAFYQGHDDYVRGIHAMGRGALLTVGDDGAVAMYSRAPNLESPVMPLRRFEAESINVMSSVFISAVAAGAEEQQQQQAAPAAAAPVLVTGGLNGALRMWKMSW